MTSAEVLIDLTRLGQELRQRALAIPPAVVAKLGMEIPELEALHAALTRVIAAATARTSTKPRWWPRPLLRAQHRRHFHLGDRARRLGRPQGHRAIRRLQANPSRGQSDMTMGQLFLDLTGTNAPAVVRDPQPRRSVMPRELDTHDVGLRVFHHVGQEFPGRRQQESVGRGPPGFVPPFGVDRDLEPTA